MQQKRHQKTSIRTGLRVVAGGKHEPCDRNEHDACYATASRAGKRPCWIMHRPAAIVRRGRRFLSRNKTERRQAADAGVSLASLAIDFLQFQSVLHKCSHAEISCPTVGRKNSLRAECQNLQFVGRHAAASSAAKITQMTCGQFKKHERV